MKVRTGGATSRWLWPSPPARMRDPGTDIHLLSADLDRPKEQTDLYRLMLAAPEARRVDAIAHPATRARMTVALGMARVLLAAHDLEGDLKSLAVRHARAESRAVFAVARAPVIGLAVVPVRGGRKAIELGARSALEHAGALEIELLPSDLEQGEFALARGRAVVLRASVNRREWTVQALTVDPSLVVLVASEGRRRNLRCWALPR